MKVKLLFICIVTLFTCSNIIPQCNSFVTIDGKKFKCGTGEDFFAVVCNYNLQFNYEDGLSANAPEVFPNYFAARHRSEIPSRSFNTSGITTQAQAYQSMKNDFLHIKSLGFNTLRITGICYEAAWTSINWYGGKEGPATTYAALPCFNMLQSDFSVGYRVLNASNNNFDLLLDITENVLQAAKEADLKVILLAGNYDVVLPWGALSNPSLSNGYISYLTELSKRFAKDPTLLAVDFVNEPDLLWKIPDHITYSYDKSDVCALTKQWHDAVKANSQILTTVGLYDYTATYGWDPDVLHLDFVSFHPYPEIKDKLYATDLIPHTIESMKARYWWYSQYIKIPWMIGETAITANMYNTTHPINNGYTYSNPDVNNTNQYLFDKNHLSPGTMNDQATYLEHTLNSCRDFGGLGYSWWAYFDGWVGNPSYPISPAGNNGNYWGLVYTSEPNLQNFTKPAAAKVQAFWSTIPGTMYLPPNYYNFYNESPIPANNVFIGHVIDNNNQPVKGAIIEGADARTFSDANGYFTLKATKPVGNLRITGLGCTVITPSGPVQNQNTTWQLTRIPRPAIPTTRNYSNQNVINANVNDYAGIDANFSSNYSVISGNFNITAGSVIRLQPGFSALSSSNFKASIGKYYDDCSSFSFRPSNELTEITNAQLPSSSFALFPNPSNGKYTFKCLSNENYEIKVYNIQGAVMKTVLINEKEQEITIENLANGIYFFNIKNSKGEESNIKVIKQ